MANGYTWFDIFQRASAEAGLVAPNLVSNHVLALGYASEAQNIYQTRTAVVRRIYEIALDPNSPDGVYELPCSISKIIRGEWFANGDSMTQTAIPAEVVPWEVLRGYEIAQNQIGTCSPADPNLQTKMLIAHSFNQLYVYPFTATTGTLRIYAIPHLVPYSPGNTEDWASFGEDPAQAMKQCGPEPEYIPALYGIVAYTKAMMIANLPNGLAAYLPVYQKCMADFERAITDVRRVDTSYSKNYRAKASYSPVR